MPKLFSTILTKLIFLTLATSSLGADLAVKIIGLRNNKGDVHIALYDRPITFPNSTQMLREVKKFITNRKTEHCFTDLTPGHYALATYHDENGNHSFDTNFLGLPTEGYAFSNNAKAFLGPPSFLDAQIALKLEGSAIQIKMGY